MKKNFKPLLLFMIITIFANFQCESIFSGDLIFFYGDAPYRPDHVPGQDIPVGMQIEAGSNHTCALYAGKIHCWGADWNNQTTVPTLNKPTQISVGADHSCALDSNGVVCWGDDTNGQSTPP